MNTRRWLLPFTQAVSMQAIDSAVSLAQRSGAMLIAVSLVSVPKEPRGRVARGVRLEYIQQSKDFLEAVKWTAARYKVPVERSEVFTSNVLQSITLLVQDQRCDSIVLVTGENKEVLLGANELKQLLEVSSASLVLIRLPAQTRRAQAQPLVTRFLSWLRRLWGRTNLYAVPVEDGPLWIRSEEPTGDSAVPEKEGACL